MNQSSREAVSYFRVSEVSHDFIGIFAEDGNSGSLEFPNCHNDIICPIATNFQIEGRAVCRLILDGTVTGTGSLINNVQFNGRPFVITANHNFILNPNQSNVLFYFNYDKPICNGTQDGQINHFMQGCVSRAIHLDTDTRLLELSNNVPSSFQPFFLGWDQTNSVFPSAEVIHHPKGHPKRISFDNDPISINSNAVVLSLGIAGTSTLAANMSFNVDLDNGTTEGGSSGAPLLNQFGRIIGVHSGGFPGCPSGTGIIKHSGRLFNAWTGNNTSSTQLRAWIHPNSGANNVFQGFGPQGWIHDWLIDFNAPINQNISTIFSSLSVGAGNQVFYRGTDNKIHLMYWSGDWIHDWINGWNAPSNENIDGTLVVGAGNQVFYRGTDQKLHTYFWQNNDWVHGWVGSQTSPSSHNISNFGTSIVVGTGNQIFYRGVDNKMHIMYFSNGNWVHDWVNGWNAPVNENINGDIVIGENNQLFYVGTDNRIHTYFWQNNGWVHGWVGSSTSATSQHVKNGTNGVLIYGSLNKLYYRGNDDKIKLFELINNSWQNSIVDNNASGGKLVGGDISLNGNVIVYVGQSGIVQTYEKIGNSWTHRLLENSLVAPPLHNPSGLLAVGTGNQIFYRGSDGRCRIYYFEQSFVRSKNDNNFSIEDTPLSPTLSNQNPLELIIYPTASNDDFNFRIKSINEDQFVLSIYDYYGNLIISKPVFDLSENTINLSDTNKGLLFFEITNSKGEKCISKAIKL